MHAVELAVVAGVDDNGDLLGRNPAHQPAQEARGTDAAGQRHDGTRKIGGLVHGWWR